MKEKNSNDGKIPKICERVAEIRNFEKISQKAFGEKINLSQSQIASYEKGYRIPTDRAIDDICRVYKVNKEWLTDGVGKKFIDPLSGLDLDPEIEEMAKLYLKLTPNKREHIKKLMQKSLDSE
ncbi:helix-turn-helix domain-containing protein [Clostridioides sp. ZZV13-5731]|uniref:helix-turn-helix domain-containing protein n=1 Tax=Clostridioides sp. ZZV13-5731 TaxID=2811485 RepID=UPI001D11B9C7